MFVDLIFVILLNSYSLAVSMQIVLLLSNLYNLLFMFPVLLCWQGPLYNVERQRFGSVSSDFIYPQVGLLWIVVRYSLRDEGSCLT